MKLSLYIIASVILCHAPYPASAQDQPGRQTAYWRGSVLDDTLTFMVDGESFPVRVAFEKFTIEGFQKVSELPLPFDGLTLVQLRAGELSVVVNDSRTEAQLGEFWVVPPGATMDLETEDDKVILAIYLIDQKYLEMTGGKPLSSRSIRPDGLFSPVAENLYSRDARIIGDPDNLIARAVDFNVGPGLMSGSYTWRGVAAVQVTSGSGLIVSDNGEAEAALGDGFGFNEGQEIVIDNRAGDRPFRFRALVWEK